MPDQVIAGWSREERDRIRYWYMLEQLNRNTRLALDPLVAELYFTGELVPGPKGETDDGEDTNALQPS